MICPKCGAEMKHGFVRSINNGGLCWLDRNVPYGAPRDNAGFDMIGSRPGRAICCVPAETCKTCHIIMIDDSEGR